MIDFLFGRPAAAAVSSLQMLLEDVPIAMKIDAMMSRTIHILSRSGAQARSSARIIRDTRAGAEPAKDRTI
jgi:hypothetical protein